MTQTNLSPDSHHLNAHRQFQNLDTEAAEIMKSFWYGTHLGELAQLKLTTERNSLIKQQILMYKTFTIFF